MSRTNRHLSVIEGTERRSFGLTTGSKQGQCGHNNGELRQQRVPSFNAEKQTHATTSCRFGFSDLGHVKFGRADCLDHFLHDFPQIEAGKHALIHHFEQVKPSRIRRCIAPLHFVSNLESAA